MPSVLVRVPAVYLSRVRANFGLFYRFGRQSGWGRARASLVGLVDAFRCPF